MLTANRKQQFQVGRLALRRSLCDLYQFSYENLKIISLEEAAILNFQTTEVFDSEMATKTPIFTHWLKACTKGLCNNYLEGGSKISKVGLQIKLHPS